ncbi:MAG: ABC transporter ATP-binding protein [Candidatus Hydrogenedentes bacterium]|nr:ABC transporter ATP-binding protein [Candidatus Hydrogenedentota bacterium]
MQTESFAKCYGSVVAVSGLTMSVQEGEVFGLLGPNGAGKSTTLYALCGLIPPTSGTISLFGKDLRRNFLDVSARIGVMVERPSFYNHLSAKRNLQLLARLSRKEVTVDRALDRVGLLHLGGRKVGAMSHGMRQRLGLAQALLTEPDLLILDEPTGGMDVESTQEILKLLRFLADEAKVTIIFSSHMLHEVETLCDRIAIMNQGRLLACEETDRLISYDTSQADVLIDAPEAAAKRLKEQPWVQSVSVLPGRVRVVLNGGSVHQLTTFLIGAGYRISGVLPKRRTLQDYFVKVLHS